MQAGHRACPRNVSITTDIGRPAMPTAKMGTIPSVNNVRTTAPTESSDGQSVGSNFIKNGITMSPRPIAMIVVFFRPKNRRYAHSRRSISFCSAAPKQARLRSRRAHGTRCASPRSSVTISGFNSPLAITPAPQPPDPPPPTPHPPRTHAAPADPPAAASQPPSPTPAGAPATAWPPPPPSPPDPPP